MVANCCPKFHLNRKVSKSPGISIHLMRGRPPASLLDEVEELAHGERVEAVVAQQPVLLQQVRAERGQVAAGGEAVEGEGVEVPLGHALQSQLVRPS